MTFPTASATDVVGRVTIAYATPSGPVSPVRHPLRGRYDHGPVTATDAADSVTKRTFKVTVTYQTCIRIP